MITGALDPPRGWQRLSPDGSSVQIGEQASCRSACLKQGREQIMRKTRRRSLPAKTLLLGLVAACATALCVLAASASAATTTVVMSGLDNPRGLAFGAEGALYVAEAGQGGSGPCAVLRGVIQSCYGATGAVSRLWMGQQDRT